MQTAFSLGLPDSSIKIIQRVQNMAAKVVLNLRKHNSSTKALRELHWPPIKQQIDLKKLLEVHLPH